MGFLSDRFEPVVFLMAIILRPTWKGSAYSLKPDRLNFLLKKSTKKVLAMCLVCMSFLCMEPRIDPKIPKRISAVIEADKGHGIISKILK